MPQCGAGKARTGREDHGGVAVPAAEGREQAGKYGCGVSMPGMNYGAGGKQEIVKGKFRWGI